MWPRRLLFTVVFTGLGFLNYALVYYGLSLFAPHWLVIPVQINADYFSAVAGVFTGIVLFAFWGASSVVYGNLRGREATPGEASGYFRSRAAGGSGGTTRPEPTRPRSRPPRRPPPRRS